ncbi:hypothetical protein NECAME_09550 [Necator americanus]|uniref:Uncharacterized protein n=1 Tax=Necator americanus TaxID=51031 RepID=W2TCY0_NECAM|nr:hypothetical protein NECAME_09550 [Necator americanus]ETN79895.1 hypothetical protein NECAME_09550 [Necator americanus]
MACRKGVRNRQYGKRVVMWNCAKGYSRRKEIAYKPCPAFIRICERHCGTFEVVACFGHLGHPHTSVNPTTECRFRSETAEGAEEIEAVRELLESSDTYSFPTNVNVEDELLRRFPVALVSTQRNGNLVTFCVTVFVNILRLAD